MCNFALSLIHKFLIFTAITYNPRITTAVLYKGFNTHQAMKDADPLFNLFGYLKHRQRVIEQRMNKDLTGRCKRITQSTTETLHAVVLASRVLNMVPTLHISGPIYERGNDTLSKLS